MKLFIISQNYYVKILIFFQAKKTELKALKEIDDELLAKSSLDIPLLPETQQDRQMAALMKLQSKSAQEREEERRLDILLQPALPGATQTTFGGLKRQKALNTHLNLKQLGIKRKSEEKNNNANIDEPTSQQKNIEDNPSTSPDSREIPTTSANISKACVLDLPKSLALVCDYNSCNSSSSCSASGPSDIEES